MSNPSDLKPLILDADSAFYVGINEKLNALPTASVPLYEGKGKNYTPELTGTGFPLHIGPYKKLITAGHVTDRLTDRRFYTPNNGSLLPFNCRIHRFGHAGTSRSEDPLDISVIDLDEQQAARLRTFHFFTLEEIEHQHALDSHGYYAFTGYPATKNDGQFKTTQISPHLFRYSGISTKQEKLHSLYRPPFTHIGIDFQKRCIGSDGKPFTAPDPYGISGCPVWSLGTTPEILDAANTKSPRIAGMGIECLEQTLVAVRACLIVQVIRILHRDLADFIEECPYVRFQHQWTAPQRTIILTKY